jgi:hypothetical protein
MAKPLRKEHERWEDPIVAEVRRAREALFAAAGYDLDEFCRQLRERQEKEGRGAVTRPSRPPKREEAASAARSRPNTYQASAVKRTKRSGHGGGGPGAWEAARESKSSD